MSIRAPRLLDGSMQEVARLYPSSLSVTVNADPLSNASMTINQDKGSALSLMSFVELYGPSGSLGIYRAANISTTYGLDMRVSLEHAICTLEDDVTEADGEWSGSMSSLLGKLLAAQTVQRWQLGTVEATGSYELQVNRTSLTQALMDLLTQAEDCYPDFDQSAYPWTLHIRKKPKAIGSECRMLRNAGKVTIALDRGSLCTRVYHDTLPGGKLDADTIGAWGVVVKDAGLASPADAEDAETAKENLTKARAFLEKHKNPEVAIDVDAVELARLTGEALDRFVPGYLCRVALPEWGVTMDERIVSVHYPDLMGEPETVRLRMATTERNASTGMAGLRQDVRNTTRVVKEQRLHIDETAQEIALKASSADVTVLGSKVTDILIDMDAINAQLLLSMTQANLNSALLLTPGYAALSSSITDVDGRVDDVAITLDVQDKSIRLKADKTYVDNLFANAITAENINAHIGEFRGDLTVGHMIAQAVNATSLQADAGLAVGGNATVSGALSVGGTDCSPKKLTIGSKSCTFFAPADATFDWGDDEEVQEAIAAAAAKVTISASDIVRARDDAYNSTTHNYSVQIRATASNGKSGVQTFTVDGGQAYLAGANAVQVTPSTYTASRYTRSRYSKESHVYTASSYTASSASVYTGTLYRLSSGAYMPYTGTLYTSYTPSSYTKESHSYAASSYTSSEYTASSYTKEVVTRPT